MGDSAVNSSDHIFLEKISKKLTTKHLYEILLKISNTTNVTLDGWKEVDSGNKKGDSYLSCLYRFNVFGSQNDGSTSKKCVSAVAKGFPANIARRKTYRSPEFFENEIAFYKIWERLVEFQKEKQVKNIFNQIPRCLAALCDGENDFIILQDVSPHGYTTIDRSVSLDLEHCKLLMRLFADFHATSFVFKTQHPNEYEQLAASLRETYISDSLRKWYANFLQQLFKVWNDALEKEVPGSVYQEKFEELTKNDFYGQIIDLLKSNSKYSVICEGDAWMPNFLVKYTNKKPESAILLDFQLARSCSLVTDLAFFLFSCVDPDIRKKYWNELLEDYHRQFVAHITQFGCSESIFPFQELHDEFLKYGKFGLAMCLEALPFSMMDDDDTADLDALQGEDAVDISTVWVMKPMETKEKRMRLVTTVMEQVDRGFI